MVVILSSNYLSNNLPNLQSHFPAWRERAAQSHVYITFVVS